MMIALLLVLRASVAMAAPVYEESFISPPGTFPANHGSTLAELPGDRLLACWYAGDREGGKQVQIYCSEKGKSDPAWGAPRVAVAKRARAKGHLLRNKTLGNPALHLDSEGYLWLFFTSVSIGGWAGGRVDYQVSSDYGQTWSQSRRLEGGLGHLSRIKPFALDDGSFLLPLYREFTYKQGYVCHLKAHAGEITEKTCEKIPGRKHLQPALARLGSDIFAYLRNETGTVLVSKRDAASGKWSWPVATDLPNPNSSVEASTAPDGRVMLFFNDSTSERTPLAMALSSDGIHFERVWNFDDEANSEFSYPAVIPLSDGTYLLSYTYHHRDAIKSVRFSAERFR